MINLESLSNTTPNLKGWWQYWRPVMPPAPAKPPHKRNNEGTQSSPVSMALLSFFFHCSATSFARGSSGLGALNNAWIDSNTVRICRAGDHLSGRREKGRNAKRQKLQHKRQIWGKKTRDNSGLCSIVNLTNGQAATTIMGKS